MIHSVFLIARTAKYNMNALVLRVALFLGAVIGEIFSMDSSTTSLIDKHDLIPTEGSMEEQSEATKGIHNVESAVEGGFTR